ncbi:ATPase family AAA domain-containing protein 5, partial [Lecanoromycetidae sp. Uapishka_2]
MAENNGHTVHPFFMPRNDFDQNEGRRKRQRTKSPDPKPTSPRDTSTDTWADQLKNAAFGSPTTSGGTEQVTIENGQPSEQAQAPRAVTSTRRRRQRNPGNNEDLANKSVGKPIRESGAAPVNNLGNGLAATPPKKMLRVRPDGKLGSPKAQITAGVAKPRRTRRSTKAETGTKALLVTIRFEASESRLTTGRKIDDILSGARTIRLRLASGSSLELSEDQDADELSSAPPHSHQKLAHRALVHSYERIATSFTAFDKFQCEPQDWVHKYAPKAAEEVLQQSHEVILLRDWLRSLSIKPSVNQNIDKLRAKESSIVPRRRVYKKKRKRAEGLDDFVVSSEDEGSQMDEITDSEDAEPSRSLTKRSIVRVGDVTRNPGGSERSINAVIISGPHGCGKTAAVYAVAQELGFEVFEINSGSRRSGKDIMDKVGDMTRNHLVKHEQREDLVATLVEEADGQGPSDDKLKEDIASGRQGTVKSFFKPKMSAKKKQQEMKPSPRKLEEKPEDLQHQKKQQQNHKQSLILLEEVDVLFEEDKAFWTTILELILHSKRPIIMTCTEESLLPLNDTALYAILRFGPPAEQLATDYLLLVACNEGHLLSRNSVANLYRSKGFDLRASMAELNFFCQMAVGDTKGGLEWMLIRSPSDGREDQGGEPPRVVSDGTYEHGMGWLGGEANTSRSEKSIALETEILAEVWHGWGIDIGSFEDYIGSNPSNDSDEVSQRGNFEALQHYELAFEAYSAIDSFSACVSQEPNQRSLDCTVPGLREKSRTAYIEGMTLLQADPMIDQTGIANSLALTLRACSRRVLNHASRDPSCDHFDERSILHMIPEAVHQRRSETNSIKSRFSPAFDPISRSQKAVLGIPKGPQISNFDGPMSVVAEDLAPYVRSIVSYDLRLEEQRRQLSSLLSQPGQEGKKTRTTRASRAALEGGSKAHTRRERWFPNNTNFDLILQSGGKGWQDVLLHRVTSEASEDGAAGPGSPRSSLGSAMESA